MGCELSCFTLSVTNTTTASLFPILSLRIHITVIKHTGKEVFCLYNYNSSNQKINHETGRFSKFLKYIIEDDEFKAYHRARYILTLRGGVSTKSSGDDKV